jgi:DNA-binding GntR family transcriptional regulator
MIDGGGDSSLEGPLSVVDQVTESLTRLILNGDVAPGQLVAIRDLSQQLGVSHVPVREALRQLEGQGLVLFRRGKRPQIAPLDIDDFQDLFRLRRLIEADVATRSARLLTPERLAVVERLYEEMRSLLLAGPAAHVSPVHSRLHLALLPGATRWDRQVLEQLWIATDRYIQFYVLGAHSDAARVRLILELHDALVEVARHPTPASLRAAVTQHIKLSADVISAAIESAAVAV